VKQVMQKFGGLKLPGFCASKRNTMKISFTMRTEWIKGPEHVEQIRKMDDEEFLTHCYMLYAEYVKENSSEEYPLGSSEELVKSKKKVVRNV
jgi:hypothetical protein